MASSNALRIVPLPLSTLAFGAIGAAYVAVGNASTEPVRLMLVQNLTNQTLIFSHDGINDHYPIGAQTALIFDICANSATTVIGAYFQQGLQMYVKDNGVAPIAGSVYITFFVGIDI